jgi:hypothetical protein
VAKLTAGQGIVSTELGKLLAPKNPISEHESDTFWNELNTTVGALIPKADTPPKSPKPPKPQVVEVEISGMPTTIPNSSGGGGGGGWRSQVTVRAYETGGLADFTGPAWLDGTKSHPELVLNARDTKNFIQLKDILAHVLDRTGSTTNNTSSGDNYYEIEINVDSIEGDYDVEQMADKIRDMIYSDATRRNVNAVN